MIFTQEQLKHMFDTKSYHIEYVSNNKGDIIGINQTNSLWDGEDLNGNKIFSHWVVYHTINDFIKEIKEL